MLMQPSVECLSLTIEEVMHIRNVLTKAELECIVIQPELYNLLVNKKVRSVHFSLFLTESALWCCLARVSDNLKQWLLDNLILHIQIMIIDWLSTYIERRSLFL